MSYPVKSDSTVHPFHFRGITLDRLNTFEGGPYSHLNLTSVLYTHRLSTPSVILLSHWPSPGRTKTPFPEAIKQPFVPVQKGLEVGPSWTHHWFKVEINVPEEWSECERVQLEWDPSAEAMVFREDGLPLQGITGGFDGTRRVDFILDAKKRGWQLFYIEVSCNGMFGNGVGNDNDPPNDDRTFKLESADLVVPNMDAWRLHWDFRTLKDLARSLPDNSPLGNKCLEVANQIMNVFKSDELESIAKCRTLAEKVFGQGWEKLGAGIYKGDPEEAATWGIGNCHIDTAWLWPYSATQQKTARSWSTQIDLMNRYPEYTFVASQAQQFAWLEKDYPLLFAEIQKKVKTGQFQTIGGCWVEMDTNLPSGEALVRQFLFGQRYFRSRFGSYNRTFWLPDSFGYSSQLPQLCRLAGMDFFFTQKLSWSQFNSPVHTSFKWVGQDGSQVVVHMTPVNTYTAQASVDDVLNSIKNHKSLQSGAATGLLAFGNGDGGGGPLAPMLENLRRCRAVSEKSGELPKVTMGQTVDGFYDDILEKTENGKTLPTWNGELYLELHRGTATSHGSIKRGNRKCEILLREIEYAATLASVANSFYEYPKEQLDRMWEGVLLNQFHDVLPGSGIEMIYVDAERIYAEVKEKGRILLEEALAALIVDSSSARDVSSLNEEDLIAINTTPFARRELVKISVGAARDLPQAAVQRSHDGMAYVLLDNVKGEGVVPVTSMVELVAKEVVPARAQVVEDGFELSNQKLEIHVSNEGRITSIFDVELERELVLEGHTAGFVLFEDRPCNWDAWDVDIYHLETKSEVNAISVRIVEDGPLRATIEATYQVGQSTIKTFISLDALPPLVTADALSLVRFDTVVDWHEKHQFLKFELPLEIRSEVATYENQFGFCQRPTTRNTSWDRAKFEVVGHKFADLSEFGYGVALLNDCKYGYACEGSILRLSLLRSPTSPDAHCDEGFHKFSFAILPHRGSFAESDVPVAGWIFNSPHHLRRIPRISVKKTLEKEHAFKVIGSKNVILDTVKRAEDDSFECAEGGHGLEHIEIVLRLYEAYGGHGKVSIETPYKVSRAWVCDLLERDISTVGVARLPGGGSAFKLAFSAFQVLTVKLMVQIEAPEA